MAFELPKLPYAYDALEPHIDARTMEIHHGKHHNAYVTNLNAAIAGTDLDGKSLEELMKVAGTNTAVSTAPKAASVADYAPTEKLRLEKELVGFYLSDHPLKQLKSTSHLLSPVGLAQLEEQADRSRISALVMVPEIKLISPSIGALASSTSCDELFR